MYSTNLTSQNLVALGLGPVVAAMVRRFVPEFARRPVLATSPSVTDVPARRGRFLPPVAADPARRSMSGAWGLAHRTARNRAVFGFPSILRSRRRALRPRRFPARAAAGRLLGLAFLLAAAAGAQAQAPTPATRPGLPQSLAVAPGNAEATLSWSAPADPGSSPVTHYQYRVSAAVGTSWNPDWSDVPDGTDAGSDAGDQTEYTISGLNNETAYSFELRAVTVEAPGVSIVADNPGDDAIFGVDDVDFTVTREGATTSALDVSVTLTQDQSFLPNSELSLTVTIAAGQSSARTRVSAVRFNATVAAGGTLTATVGAGTGYEPAWPHPGPSRCKRVGWRVLGRPRRAGWRMRRGPVTGWPPANCSGPAWGSATR